MLGVCTWLLNAQLKEGLGNCDGCQSVTAAPSRQGFVENSPREAGHLRVDTVRVLRFVSSCGRILLTVRGSSLFEERGAGHLQATHRLRPPSWVATLGTRPFAEWGEAPGERLVGCLAPLDPQNTLHSSIRVPERGLCKFLNIGVFGPSSPEFGHFRQISPNIGPASCAIVGPKFEQSCPDLGHEIGQSPESTEVTRTWNWLGLDKQSPNSS